MKIVGFYHSLVSDWNHGNAHFLRGVARELIARGHEVEIWEPRTGWSRRSLVEERGEDALAEFRAFFPELRTRLYDVEALDVAEVTDGAQLVLVHEWSQPWLVRAVGTLRARGARFRLLFHDTHHRSLTAPEEMERYDLSGYDGVLAYGEIIRRLYLERGWADRVWTWHEAADTRLFRPLPSEERDGDLVWVGNWGDDERTQELDEFLVEPSRKLGLSGSIYGVRYPDDARKRLERAGLRYRGWIANYRVPELFARHAVTVHVPRRPYTQALRGVPTIRPFEALACGIPLVSSPWDDAEGLFRAGTDYLLARDGREMARHLREVLNDAELRVSLVRAGLETVRSRHTCAHRVDELLAVFRELTHAEAA